MHYDLANMTVDLLSWAGFLQMLSMFALSGLSQERLFLFHGCVMGSVRAGSSFCVME